MYITYYLLSKVTRRSPTSWNLAWVSGLPKGLGERRFQLSPFFASIFPLFPRNAWYSGYLKLHAGACQICGFPRELITLRVAQFLLNIAQLAMEARGLGACDSTPIMAPVQISEKQTVLGNTCFKVFFFIIASKNLISNSIIVLSLMCWKSHMVKLQN